MMISFVGAATFYSYSVVSAMCEVKTYKVMAASFFFSWNNEYWDFISGVIIWRIGVFVSVFYLNAMIWLNWCLAIDLVYMIKYPFKPSTKRMYLFYGLTFLGSAGLGFANLVAYDRDFAKRNKRLSTWLCLSSLIYIITALISIFYSWVKLRSPGISQEVRKLVFIRHVTTILLFSFGYTYFFISAFIYRFYDPDLEKDVKWPFLNVTKVIFALQGLYLPLMRFAEPAFTYTLKNNLRLILCCRRNMKEVIDVSSLLERSESFTKVSTVW